MSVSSPTPLALNYAEAGDPANPALVIVHGLFGSLSNWRSIARKLSETFYVLTLDLRNHGDSPWHEEMNYRNMAIDVAWFIEQHGLVAPALLGHSMGGKTVMALVQMKLTTIRKLIVADIAPVSYQHSHQEFIDIMQSVDFPAVNSRSDVDKILAQSIAEPPVRQFLLQNLVRDQGTYRWRINIEAIEDNMPSLLDYPLIDPCNCEALFISGANSTYITEESSRAIGRIFPLSRTEIIDNAGHWLHAEQPERFVSLTQEFLSI